MQPTAQSRFADHLCRFLATATAPRFATGQWLKSLSEDDLYRLNCLIGLALEHNFIFFIIHPQGLGSTTISSLIYNTIS